MQSTFVRTPHVLAALASLFFLSMPAFGQDFKVDPVAEKLRASSVTVRTPRASGSGFVICKGSTAYVLTAAHVVDDLRREEQVPGSEKRRVVFDEAKVIQKAVQGGRIVREVSYEASVVRFSADEDLAILKLHEQDAFKAGLTLFAGESIPPLGLELWHVGSPLGEIGAQSLIPAWMSQHGVVIEKKTMDRITCSAFPGSSGGAVTLKDGRVVGVVVRGKEGGFILMVPIRRVKEWTSRIGAGFLFDPKVCTPESFEKGSIEEK